MARVGVTAVGFGGTDGVITGQVSKDGIVGLNFDGDTVTASTVDVADLNVSGQARFTNDNPIFTQSTSDWSVVGAQMGNYVMACDNALISPNPTLLNVRTLTEWIDPIYRKVSLFFYDGISVLRTSGTPSPNYLLFTGLGAHWRPDSYVQNTLWVEASKDMGGFFVYTDTIGHVTLLPTGELRFYNGSSYTSSFDTGYLFTTKPFSMSYIESILV